MIIILKIDDFFFEIFPKIKDKANQSIIISELERFYSVGPFKPHVSIAHDIVTIKIDTQRIAKEESTYNKAVNLCEKGRFDEAKTILTQLVDDNPTNSEYHRLLGQIHSEQGSQDEAINELIDSLRWDPNNEWALIMMGNIFARYKEDIDTAMKYYDRCLEVDSKNNIALNNIGANLLQKRKFNAAKPFFLKAKEINPKYPNTQYALAIIEDENGNKHKAIEYLINALKNSTSNNPVYQQAFNSLIEISQDIFKSSIGSEIFKEYLLKLEKTSGKEIKVEEDSTIPTAAKIEFAENYSRDFHLIKYKPGYPAVDHLKMHELVHLDFIIEARKTGSNKLFTSNGQNKAKFIGKFEVHAKKLHKMGIPESSLVNYYNEAFNGINRQVFNAPIDLFIEDFLFNNFPELRSYQFISLYSLIKEGITATTKKEIVELTPQQLLSQSKVYNIVSALHFKDLFGIDLVSDFKPTAIELRQAETFFNEFSEYRLDRGPGEEYELVQNWGIDLKLQDNFELVNEDEYRKRRSSNDIIESIEKDPLGLKDDVEYKDQEMKKFLETHEKNGLNPAVMMYMMEALKFFEGMKKEEVKEIAFEIAMLGTQGIKPGTESKYKLNRIPGKAFSGYHLLAYYYVSWAIAIPDMLNQLHLPYDNEYKNVLQYYKS